MKDSFKPTCELRWKMLYSSMSRFADSTYSLEQKWEDGDGNEEWRLIPILRAYPNGLEVQVDKPKPVTLK